MDTLNTMLVFLKQQPQHLTHQSDATTKAPYALVKPRNLLMRTFACCVLGFSFSVFSSAYGFETATGIQHGIGQELNDERVEGLESRDTASEPFKPFELEILHTNDTHAFAAGVTAKGTACDNDEKCFGGYARIAAAIKAEKAMHPHVLALDAGDRWQGTLFFRTGGPDFIARAGNGIPWDAVTLGNHEFDLGIDRLAQYLDDCAAPTLAANLRAKPGSPIASLKETKFDDIRLYDFNGIKVGLFGLANSDTNTFAIEPETLSKALDFTDLATAARDAVQKLERQGAHIIIALTHEGYEADQALAAQVEGIDVIVGGHTHSLLGTGLPGAEGPYPTVVEKASGERTLVVQAKRSTEYLGRLFVRFSPDGRVQTWSGGPLRLTPQMPRDPAVEKTVTDAARRIEAFRNTYVSTNPNHYADGLDPCREGECLSGLLAADAYLSFTKTLGADIALVNGGAIRSALPEGRVDRGALMEMHPFGNHLALIEVSGRDIVDALEHGVIEPSVDGPHLLQPAGLRYRIDVKAPIGHRIRDVEVERLEANGQHIWRPIDESGRYRVVTLEYLARGGDGFSVFARAKHLPCVPCEKKVDIEIFERHLAAHDPIPMPETKRITGFGPAAY